MPRFTPGGIQAPTADDKIKDGTSPSALADNFWALAQTADNQANTVANTAGVAAVNAAISDAATKYGGLSARIDTLKTSHIALDTDGVPYYEPGSMTVQVLQDIDGTPYFMQALA